MDQKYIIQYAKITDKEVVDFLKKHDIIMAKTRSDLKKLKRILEEFRNDPLFRTLE